MRSVMFSFDVGDYRPSCIHLMLHLDVVPLLYRHSDLALYTRVVCSYVINCDSPSGTKKLLQHSLRKHTVLSILLTQSKSKCRVYTSSR